MTERIPNHNVKTKPFLDSKVIDLKLLKNLKLVEVKGLYRASLIDDQGYAVIHGYGVTVEEAVNDMFRAII